MSPELRERLAEAIRDIIDGGVEVFSGVNYAGEPFECRTPQRVWCGCYEGDMDDSYPYAKEAVTQEILALIEREFGP